MALQSQYGFTAGSGTVSADSSGNGRDLTASNTTTSWDAAGKNGAGARVTHTGNPGANLSLSAYTVMMWVKRTGTWTGFAAAFGNDASTTARFYLEADAAASYAVDWFGGVSGQQLNATTPLALDTWIHFACVREAGGTARLYVNGIQEATNTGANAMNFGINTWGVAATATLTGENSDFVGILDEVRVFDTALTAGEITTQMGTGVDATTDSYRATRPFVGPYPRLMRTGLLKPLQFRGDRSIAITSFNGTAALAATATITADGVVATSSTATLTTTATTTTTGAAQGTTTVAATATITAVGNISTTATADVTTVATITAAGQVTGTVNLTATAAIDATATAQGTASLVETATISAISGGDTTGAASVAATAAITAAGAAQGAVSAALPSNLAGLAVWYKASDLSGLTDGTAVSSWTSAAGTSVASQATGANQPTKQTASGAPVVRFDGTNDSLSLNGDALSMTQNVSGFTLFVKAKVASTSNGTVFAVDQGTTTANHRAILRVLSSVWNAGGRRLDADSLTAVGTLTPSTTTPQVVSAVFDYTNTDLNLYVDGAAGGSNLSFQTSGSTSNTASFLVTIGCAVDSTLFKAMDLYEVVAYNRALDAADRQAVEAYLATSAPTAIQASITTTGRTDSAVGLTETTAITAVGNMAASAGASLTATAAISVDGLLVGAPDPNQAPIRLPGFLLWPEQAGMQMLGDQTVVVNDLQGTASLTANAAITAAGAPQGTASLVETATISASSSGNFTGAATLTVTASTTTASQTQGTASLTETVVTTASATGNITGTVSHTETATITATGNMSASGTTSSTITATITAAGQVAGTATRTTTVTTTANGRPISDVTRTTTATITTLGNMSATGVASQAIVATITATGNVQTGATATQMITAVISASGALILLYEGELTGGRREGSSLTGSGRTGQHLTGGRT